MPPKQNNNWEEGLINSVLKIVNAQLTSGVPFLQVLARTLQVGGQFEHWKNTGQNGGLPPYYQVKEVLDLWSQHHNKAIKNKKKLVEFLRGNQEDNACAALISELDPPKKASADINDTEGAAKVSASNSTNKFNAIAATTNGNNAMQEVAGKVTHLSKGGAQENRNRRSKVAKNTANANPDESDDEIMTLNPDDPFKPMDDEMKRTLMMEKHFERIKNEINDAIRDNPTLKQELKDHPIIIASLDTGCFSSHQFLEGMVIHNESTDPDDDPQSDDENHGTIVAGIISRNAGQIVNGCKGSDSIVELVNIKLSDKNQSGEDFKKAFEIIKKFEKDNKRKIDVITTSCTYTKEQIKKFRSVTKDNNNTLQELSSERVIMAAVANDGKIDHETVHWPAFQGSVLGINALDDMGNAAKFSSQGDGVNFAFPGESVASTSRPPTPLEMQNDNSFVNISNLSDDWWIENQSGTSFAAPHAASAVAIVLAYIHTGLGKDARDLATNTEFIKDLMMELGSTTVDHQIGYGFPSFSKLHLDGIKRLLAMD